MIAVKIGTTGWRSTEALAADEVEFTGKFLYETDGLTPAMVWDAALNNVRPRNAEEAHAAALAQITAQIKAERERRQLSDGFPVTLPGLGTVRFHSDAHSRSQHAGLYASATLTLMQGGTTSTPLTDPVTGQQVKWTTMSGVDVPLSVGLLLLLLQASMAREGAAHNAAKAHIAAAALLDDPTQYDYSTGWPE